jgi:hypothetical protein
MAAVRSSSEAVPTSGSAPWAGASLNGSLNGSLHGSLDSDNGSPSSAAAHTPTGVQLLLRPPLSPPSPHSQAASPVASFQAAVRRVDFTPALLAAPTIATRTVSPKRSSEFNKKMSYFDKTT